MADPAYDRLRRAQVTVEVKNPRPGQPDRETANVTAPYAFVGLESFCLPTPWGSAPRLDKPHPDAICGELTVDWTAESSILVGGTQQAGDVLRFFRTDHGEESMTIPGSTLRGALRALLEPMTMARMEHVDRDATYSVRDLGGRTGNNRWAKSLEKLGGPDAIRQAFLRPGKCGWGDPEWQWTPVAGAKIPTSELLKHFRSLGRIVDSAAFGAASVSQKFELLGIDPNQDYHFAPSEGGKFVPVSPMAREIRSDHRIGRFVLSGTDPNYSPKTMKKHEHVFFTDRLAAARWEPLPPEDLVRFKFIHSRIARGDVSTNPRGTLDFWEEAFRAKPASLIPVFYFDRRDYPESDVPTGLILALARSFKMPHARSVGAVLARQRPLADGDHALDFVQALFGHVPHEGEDAAPPPNQPRQSAWRGRVTFSDAPLAEGSPCRVEEKSGIASAPRPSFWPYYLEPKTGGEAAAPVDWSDANANLAGFKRYPVRLGQSPFVQPASGGQNQQEARHAMLSRMAFVEPGPNGLRFRGRIRFHNLLPAELGALIFAIEFGMPGRDDAPHRHAIGRGKPQGHGRVRARIDAAASRFERNDGAAIEWPALAQDCVAAFQAFVVAHYARLKRVDPAPDFFAIPAVAQTLAMQDPAIGEALNDRLVYPVERGPAVADSILKAYGVIGKAAKEGQPAARLPRYPTRREQG